VPVDSFRLEAGQVVFDLQKTPGLTAIGGSVKLEFNHPDDGTSTRIILVHPEGVSYMAFANTCTHKGKELEYDHAARRIQCVSGHSDYDLSGLVLGGNANRPLKGYPTQIEGDTLFIKL
jgi:Rieske Fe-S protein